ncbi:MAG: hypothetical protein P8I94_04320 [Emcibacteraceae bacterium]|nr:hypothetical protein [Emcibacteraceae bacterium]
MPIVEKVDILGFLPETEVSKKQGNSENDFHSSKVQKRVAKKDNH